MVRAGVGELGSQFPSCTWASLTVPVQPLVQRPHDLGAAEALEAVPHVVVVPAGRADLHHPAGGNDSQSQLRREQGPATANHSSEDLPVLHKKPTNFATTCRYLMDLAPLTGPSPGGVSDQTAGVMSPAKSAGMGLSDHSLSNTLIISCHAGSAVPWPLQKKGIMSYNVGRAVPWSVQQRGLIMSF